MTVIETEGLNREPSGSVVVLYRGDDGVGK